MIGLTDQLLIDKEQLTAEVKRLKELLELAIGDEGLGFYGEAKNYHKVHIGEGRLLHKIMKDGGKLAREILKELDDGK